MYAQEVLGVFTSLKAQLPPWIFVTSLENLGKRTRPGKHTSKAVEKSPDVWRETADADPRHG